MDTPPPLEKKGLGPLGWLGIGCGGLVLLAVAVFAFGVFKYGGQFKEFADESQKNPTRAAATLMVKMSAGQAELVAEDDVSKRYTVRQKSNGMLTTIYWSAKKNAPEVVQGDFSAIPAEAAPAPAPK
jgi:hypothetical protein